MGTIFIAGVYGVGKSTLCASLSHSLAIPAFSAGDLISEINGEDYKQNKAVQDAERNQEILAAAVGRRLAQYPMILLSGHFCIFSAPDRVEVLPCEGFERLHIRRILLLEANTDKIIENLASRDYKRYDPGQVRLLRREERAAAGRTAAWLGCPLDIHYMSFDGEDSARCFSILQGAPARKKENEYRHFTEGRNDSDSNID